MILTGISEIINAYFDTIPNLVLPINSWRTKDPNKNVIIRKITTTT